MSLALETFVGMPSKFEITTVNNPPKLPCVLTSDVSCTLVPCHNQMAGKIMCECRREVKDKIVVSYTARESGVYNMQLKLDGNCVLGQLTVMIAPSFAYENTIKPVENLLEPTGVSVCNNGVIVLAESAGNVVMLKELGNKRKRFGKCAGGSANGQFLKPTAVAFVPDVLQIIVADTGNHRIQKFDLQGQLVDGVGSMGQRECQFDKLVAITIDSKKRVYVAEAGNSRIQVLSSELSFVRFIQCPQGMTPTGISVDSEDNLYVSYASEKYVHKLKLDGQHIGNIGAVHLTDPSCLTVSPLDLLYVGDKATKVLYSSALMKSFSIRRTTKVSLSNHPSLVIQEALLSTARTTCMLVTQTMDDY